MPPTQKTRREVLEQFVAEKPGDAFARYGLALECTKSGDDQAATGHFEKLLESNPAYVAGYFQFGQHLSRVGEIERARKLLSEGILVAQNAGDMHARDEMQALLSLMREFDSESPAAPAICDETNSDPTFSAERRAPPGWPPPAPYFRASLSRDGPPLPRRRNRIRHHSRHRQRRRHRRLHRGHYSAAERISGRPLGNPHRRPLGFSRDRTPRRTRISRSNRRVPRRGHHSGLQTRTAAKGNRAPGSFSGVPCLALRPALGHHQLRKAGRTFLPHGRPPAPES